MTDHEDVRRALDAVAAGAPGEAGTVRRAHERIRQVQRRRTQLLGAAVVLTLVAGSFVALRGSGTRDVVAAGPSPTDTFVAPTESPVPTASPTRSAPPPRTPSPTVAPRTTAPPPTAEPTPTPTGTAPDRPPRAIPAPAPGDPLHVYVELVTGEPRSGYDVEFRVTMTDGDGTGRLSQISWGDGTAVRFGYPAIACPSPPASSPPRRDEPSTKVETIRHGYRHAGSRRVTVEVNSPSDCRPDRDAELVSGTTTVDVAVGVQRSNGPHDATVDAYREPAPDDRARFVGIAAAGRDDDGYPRSLTVDWGDGSASRPVTNDADCDDGSGAHYPYDRNGPSAFSGDFSHTYAKPGTYAVRVLFFSTGCDGSDQQAGTAALRVSV